MKTRLSRKVKNLIRKPVDALSDFAIGAAAFAGLVTVGETGNVVYHHFTDTHQEKIRTGIFKKQIVTVKNFNGKIVK